MDDLLPSYESAIQRDPWPFIARFLPSNDLCAAALVCRRWHDIFTPNLWGSPASHFGLQNDVVYVALTRFKRTLPYVRPHIRELTHTLHFPPAHAELYDGPHSEWLRDCLEYLPRLQCLIVDGLPFFDHASLLSLRSPSLRSRSPNPNAFSVFSLRLLDAAGCTNATSTGLAEALPHFPDLVSLDLSRTPSARDGLVLRNLRYLRNLRVLSLKSLGLKDSDFSIIAHAIGTRVRSLDLSNNLLTDNSARLLLQYCLKETVIEAHLIRGPLPPVAHTHEGDEADTFEAENLVVHLRRKLTEGFIGSLAIEEARDVGITHLYVTNNPMTVEGVSGLLRSKRLQVLDIGTLSATVNEQRDLSPKGAINSRFPGVSKLGPILSKYASAKLKYLRVNHELITEDAPTESTVPACRAELSEDHGRYDPAGAHELAAPESLTPELDATANAISELAGDFVYPVEISASTSADVQTSRLSDIAISPVPFEVKHGGAYDTEAIVPESPLTPMIPVSAEGKQTILTSEHDHTDGYLSPLSPTGDFMTTTTGAQDPIVRPYRHSSHYIDDRRARLSLRQSQEHCFHPGMLPKVHTLVLTGVPTMACEKKTIDRIIQFVKDAAEEAFIAKQRARHTYMLPPGRSRAVAEQQYARDLFSLQRIVLEMALPQAAPKKISSSWRSYPTKSSTEDADSEALWEAAKHDFSFFHEEECGLPNVEPGRTLPLMAMGGLEIAPASSKPLPDASKIEASSQPLLDVIGALGAFRKERKAIYNSLVQRGEADTEVEGYWPGDITIIRNSTNPNAGESDYYGNWYEAGWYYR